MSGVRFRRFGEFFLGVFRRLTNNTNYLIRGVGWVPETISSRKQSFPPPPKQQTFFFPFPGRLRSRLGPREKEEGRGEKSSINSGKKPSSFLPSVGGTDEPSRKDEGASSLPFLLLLLLLLRLPPSISRRLFARKMSINFRQTALLADLDGQEAGRRKETPRCLLCSIRRPAWVRRGGKWDYLPSSLPEKRAVHNSDR